MLWLLLLLWLSLLSACQSSWQADSIMLHQSLPVTLRDMDDEYAAAKQANLSFYSPRFFQNVEKSYQTIASLRASSENNVSVENYLAIFKHNLRRAYATKASVQQRMGKLLVQYLRLEGDPVYHKYPEKFQELELLMTNCLKLLELRQIDSLSWDKLQAEKFADQRKQFQQALDEMEKRK